MVIMLHRPSLIQVVITTYQGNCARDVGVHIDFILTFPGEFGTPRYIGSHEVWKLDSSLGERCQYSGKRAILLPMDW